MRLITESKLDFSDVLLVPQRSTIVSRKDVELKRLFKFKHSDLTWIGVPIISSNMTTVTNAEVIKVLADNRMLACAPKNMDITELCVLSIRHHNVIASHGLDVRGFVIPVPHPYMLCIDVANGYMEKFVEAVKWVRNQYPHMVVIAGNVVTPEMTTELILAGADVVKVGLGSGAACATRLKTGVGYPQFSAIVECANAAHGLGGHIISDGGCVHPGDIAKAFGAGADFVMLGSMLSGYVENGTEFYGESSKRANEKIGGLKDYRASEGWELEVPLKGNLQDAIQNILGGLRSACSYVGAVKLKDLPKCSTFIQVNRQLNTSLWEYRKEQQ